MTRIARTLTLALAVLGLVLLGAGRVAAQTVVVSPPAVSYYSAPAVTYYSPPAVSYYSPPVVYTPAPAVSYSYGSVSYYTPAPVVSYYSAPATVTTTRYGLFGRPRVSTTYYPPVYVGR
jgi:hypothetical protein